MRLSRWPVSKLQLFKIFDSMMAAHISATAVSTVAYLSQINMMLSALGGGLAVGASIKISEAYGSGDFQLVKKRVSTLFAMCAILGLALLVILVPFTPQFLRLAKTPEVSQEEPSILFWSFSEWLSASLTTFTLPVSGPEEAPNEF